MADLGALFIWSRVAPEVLSEYGAWLSREHVGQRVFSDGFLTSRTHVQIGDPTMHLILYLTDDPARFGGQPYLDVLNNPTPWTTKMMPLLASFDRAVARQVLKVGDGSGPFISVVRAAGIDADFLRLVDALTNELSRIDGFVTLRLLEVDRDRTDLGSAEKKMRHGDEGAFSHILVCEGMSSEAASVAIQAAQTLLEAVAITNEKFCIKYVLEPFEKGVPL